MKYRLIILFFFIISCAQNYSKSDLKKPFSATGFAYIYNDQDFENKIIKKKLDNNFFQIAHYRLRPGCLIKLTNLNSIILYIFIKYSKFKSSKTLFFLSIR